MADAVTSHTLVDGSKNVVMLFTNLSDGTGESAVKKVDVSALTPAASLVTVEEIWYSIAGMTVALLWDATTDVKFAQLSGDGHIDLTDVGGIPNNAGTGVTGDIFLTTSGHTSGDNYTIILKMRKG